MHLIEEKWRDASPPFTVPAAFKNAALREHGTRWEWMLFDIHYAAYSLSPKYHADNIFGITPVIEGAKRIMRFYTTNNAEYNRCLAQFAEFKNTNQAGNPTEKLSSKFWWQVAAAWGPVA